MGDEQNICIQKDKVGYTKVVYYKDENKVSFYEVLGMARDL